MWPKNRGYWAFAGLAGMLLCLGGCAAHYSCSRFPQNHCENMSSIYAQTGANFVDYRQNSTVVDDTVHAKVATTATPASALVWQPAAPGDPVLTADQVIRIWITPWQDQEGDLDADYVYLHLHSAAWRIKP